MQSICSTSPAADRGGKTSAGPARAQPSIPLQDRWLSLSEIIALTGLSRVTIWRMERANKFPKRRRISANRVAWVGQEYVDWDQERKASVPQHQGAADVAS